MNKAINILFIVLIFIANATAQQKVYYKTDTSKKILTEESYKQLKKSIKEQLSNRSGTLTMNEILVDSINSNDSIIKTIKLDIHIKHNQSTYKRTEERISNILNKPLPNFNLNTIDGKAYTLEYLKGKPTLINLWFTRCKPCIEEIPILNELAQKYSDRVNFVTITPDHKTTTTEFLKNKPFNFTHLVDARSYLEKLGNSSYPKNLFIDKNGIVKKIARGIPYTKKNGKMILGNAEIFEKYILELIE
ncbi:hypothetical protein MHTCC0001_32690 [Flavobacteriaceae bacterium MHTCC 0001]